MSVSGAEQIRTLPTVDVILAEYNWLTSVVSMYLRWQQEILYLVIVLISGAAVVLQALPHPFEGYGLLILPIPVALLALVLAGLQSRVTQASFYIHQMLKSKMTGLIGSDVMGWAYYLNNPPPKLRFELGLFPVLAYYLPIWAIFILGEIVPIIIFFAFISSPGTFQTILIVIDVVLVIITLGAFYIVAMPRVQGEY